LFVCLLLRLTIVSEWGLRWLLAIDVCCGDDEKNRVLSSTVERDGVSFEDGRRTKGYLTRRTKSS
jgi:hypothetical protein